MRTSAGQPRARALFSTASSLFGLVSARCSSFSSISTYLLDFILQRPQLALRATASLHGLADSGVVRAQRVRHSHSSGASRHP